MQARPQRSCRARAAASARRIPARVPAGYRLRQARWPLPDSSSESAQRSESAAWTKRSTGPAVCQRRASSGRGGGLKGASVLLTKAPKVDFRRLDAEARERGADLASVIGARVKGLREPDAERRMTLGSVVAMPDHDGIRIEILTQQGRPGWSVLGHCRPELREVHLLLVDQRSLSIGQDEEVAGIGPHQ